ncbi:MAG: TonB-dependent receptor [Mediterranea sp.]|nr:TonB-dependent receptor [Mediterranea sp.]
MMMKKMCIGLLIGLLIGNLLSAQETLTNDSINCFVRTDEVTVKASLPKTKMKGDALITRIEGTVLQTAGNAEEMLARVPGMMRRGESLQVIGKGEPVYYINGRKVQDASELRRLQSSDIREVEVINAPGGAYDASVQAVVRIRTRKGQGEGWSGRLETKDEQAIRYGNNVFTASADLNYRHGSLDLFGGLNYQYLHLDRYVSDREQYTYTPQTTYHQKGRFEASEQISQLFGNVGANWQIDEHNSVGVKVERGTHLHNHFQSRATDEFFRNQALEEQLTSVSNYDRRHPDSWLANAYYNGQIGKWEIDWNIDHYQSGNQTDNDVEETDRQGTRQLTSVNDADNRLWATRLMASYPIGRGKLTLGGELNRLRRDNRYAISYEAISDNQSTVKENLTALFAEYSFPLASIGLLNMGLRYEYSDFEYQDLIDKSASLKRSTDHLYPSLSLATRIGLVQAALSYTAKTRRPSYQHLRSNIEYISRYSLQTGDPTLKNESSQNLQLNLRWRHLSLSTGYERISNGIFDWTRLYDEQGTVLFYMANFSRPLHRYSLFANYAPTVGCWSTSNTVGIVKQRLSFELEDPRTSSGQRKVSYNKPMFIFNSNNAFRLPHQWTVELNSEFYTRSHWGNAELLSHFWNLSAVVQKCWLKENALCLRLSVDDIFRTAEQTVGLDLGNYTLRQTHNNGSQRTLYALQRVNVSLRYTFNATKSKYKGTGAGQEVIQRM